jgi:Zn-dependent peptidase ImmA (M78 family)
MASKLEKFEKEIISYYKDGFSDKRIANKFGVSQVSIYYFRRYRGLVANHKNTFGKTLTRSELFKSDSIQVEKHKERGKSNAAILYRKNHKEKHKRQAKEWARKEALKKRKKNGVTFIEHKKPWQFLDSKIPNYKTNKRRPNHIPQNEDD